MKLIDRFECVNLSDNGRKRPHNEDSAVTVPALGLAIVADGMGGYKAGEVASAIAAKAILDTVVTELPKIATRTGDPAKGLRPESVLLKEAIGVANEHVFRTARDVPQCQGMGTTVVVVLFFGDRYAVAHVGDSRLYRFRQGQLTRVTSDHSLVQELVDRGFFTLEEAEANTPKNLVTRALGIDETVEADVKELDAAPDDVYLLCTDGLNDMVTDEEIRLTLSKYSASLLEAGQELIRLANENGGKDNVSVVLIRPRVRLPARGGWFGKLFASFDRGSE